MISSTVASSLSRAVLKKQANAVQIMRMSSTMPSPSAPSSSSKTEERRQMHNTAQRESDATVVMAPSASVAEEESSSTSSMTDRFVTTAEVTISKIFPAGFGWQSSSILAENTLGYAPDTMAFALTTGAGDAIGVLAGHYAYYGIKKSVTGDADIDMNKELHTGILLGSAAFCSGTAWQPLVDLLQGQELSFAQVMGGTWIGCGAAFYLGLRAARTVLSGPFEHIEGPTYDNSKNDASLSVAIGGATGFFVGTDVAYLPSQNFLLPVVGITEGTPDMMGCAIAGSSTSLGFLSAQTTMNLVFPAGKCWND